MERPARTVGFILVIASALLWGIGGTMAQKLFQEFGIDVNWFVTARLLISGVLLLAIQGLKDASQVLAVWKNKQSSARMILFGLIGMLGVQYTFMVSIDYGNAAVATLLQYLAPAMIIVYLMATRKANPSGKDFVSILLALGGCFFLLTNGSVSGLSVPVPAVIWGVVSGAALAFYTLYAVPLLEKYNSAVIVGWAMIIGGVAFSFVHPIWQINLQALPGDAYFYLIFSILFCTMIAFWLYIESLHSLSPKETSLISSLEPLAAVLSTVFWLKEPFGSFQWLGAACIIGMILLLAMFKKDPTTVKQRAAETG